MVAHLWALNTIKKFVLPEKVGQRSPKFFRGCYPLRRSIMPNFIEISQTSLEIRGGCQLGLGQKKIFILSRTDRNVTTWVATRSGASGATKNIRMSHVTVTTILWLEKKLNTRAGDIFIYQLKKEMQGKKTNRDCSSSFNSSCSFSTVFSLFFNSNRDLSYAWHKVS